MCERKKCKFLEMRGVECNNSKHQLGKRERERESSVCQYRLESYKWLSCAVEVVDWCAVKLSLTVAL